MGVFGQECAGGGTRFMKFGGAGVCKRTGTVKFHILSVRTVRYVADLRYLLCRCALFLYCTV